MSLTSKQRNNTFSMSRTHDYLLDEIAIQEDLRKFDVKMNKVLKDQQCINKK